MMMGEVADERPDGKVKNVAAVMITAACTPARPQSSSTPGTVAGGDTITARSTGRSICATAW